VGRALAVVIIMIALVSAYFFAAHTWWLPGGASSHAAALDEQFKSTFLEAGLAFVLSQILLATFVWKYRDKRDGVQPKIFPGGAKGPVITAFVLVGLELMGLELMGSKVWAKLYYEQPPANAVKVYVSAEQFAYYFRYPGPDAKFGAIHPDKIDVATGNFFGLDKENEVEARDDIVVGTLEIPVNRPVELILHAKDVNHSFYVPEMRIQQDFVPGIEIPIHFTPTKTGDYQIVCTQLCGLGHYSMKAPLKVVSQDEFDKFLQEQAANQ
jgi:cytochrome c oxidase subunit II